MKQLRLDASALVQSACMYRIKKIVVEGWREKLVFNDTLYGTSFHRFQAKMHESGGNIGEATHEAVSKFAEPNQIRDRKKHLTDQHLLKTCFDYWEKFKKQDDFVPFTYEKSGKQLPMVEVDFSLKYGVFGDYEVWLEGTIDEIGKVKNGCNCIKDYKTHSLWSISKYADKEIEEFLGRYEMSLQLRFYHFLVTLSARMNPDTEFGKLINSGPLGVFIEGVFLDSKEPTKFKRSQVMQFTEGQVSQFEVILKRKIVEITEYLNWPSMHEYPDGIISGACVDGKFPCKFWDVCRTPNPDIKKLLLERNFKQQEYKPLEFSK